MEHQMTSRKFLFAALVVFCAISFASALVADDTVKPAPARTAEDRIRELESERDEILQERFEQLTASYENGEASLDDVLNAEHDLLNARLESSATKSKRIATLRQIIKNRLRMEQYRVASFAQRTCERQVLLAARADTLNARIALLRLLPPHATVTQKE
tara:strand:- start:4092 stop:4568 length:477 start_codon:yes stop_codon:yes gene_type:complete